MSSHDKINGNNTPMHAVVSVAYLFKVKLIKNAGKARICIPHISEESHYLFRYTK